MIAGPLGAKLYDEPRVVRLLAVLAIAVPFSALNVILMAVIQARMRFRAIATIGSLAVLSNVALSIGFATRGYGVYSFVLPIPLVEAARLAVLWVLARPRMQWKPQPHLWKYFASTSLFLFLSSICALFVAQGDYILLGVFQTTEKVGLYFFGFTVATQMIRLVQGSVTSVLFPLLSSIRLEPRRVRSGFTRTVSVVSIVIVPVCMLQAAIADPLIRSLFAAKWIPAIPIIQLLSISMALHCVAEPCVALLQAQGRFAEMFRNYLIWTIGFLPIVAIAAKRGDGTAVAAAVALYYLVGSPIFFWSVTRQLGFAPLDVLRAYALPALASALAAALAIGVANMIRPSLILAMLIVSTIFGLTYIALISVFAPKPSAEVVEVGRQFIRKRPYQPAGMLENLT
jgi:PST family polysaccharide transporter